MMKLIEAGYDDDCGCIEEHLEYGGFDIYTHLTPHGEAELYIDCGEWQSEVNLKVDPVDQDQLRLEIRKIIDEIKLEA